MVGLMGRTQDGEVVPEVLWYVAVLDPQLRRGVDARDGVGDDAEGLELGADFCGAHEGDVRNGAECLSLHKGRSP